MSVENTNDNEKTKVRRVTFVHNKGGTGKTTSCVMAGKAE